MAIYLPVEIVAVLHKRPYRREADDGTCRESILVTPVHVRLPAGTIVIVDPADLVADGSKEVKDAIKAAPPARDWNGKER